MASGGENVSLAELQQRLVTFSEQLQSIHELLQSDPDNSEFLTIAQDLVEVIRLTKEMIDLKLSASASNKAISVAPEPREDRQQDSDAPEIASVEFSPGSICEALSKDVWFPAYIESLTARDSYNVHYLGFGNKDELPATSLRHVARPDDASELPGRDQITVGFKCRAKYYVDGQYYTAQVTSTTAHGFQVLFDGYGNSEEVPYEYMRPLAEAEGQLQASVAASSHGDAVGTQPQASSSASATSVPVVMPREAVVAKAIKVPENLQILPTDSEAEKERKRKRLKHIQKLNKQIEVDNTHNLKQHDWKSFQQKAIKKGTVKGSGALSKRGSMFASPDSVQGRVGVVGSGQGMTQYDATRKKIKTSHLSSAPRL